MKKTLIDAADVTRVALTGVGGGWYDDYWLGRPEPKPRLLTRLLGKAITAARFRRTATPVAQDSSTGVGSAQDLTLTAERWQSVPL